MRALLRAPGMTMVTVLVVAVTAAGGTEQDATLDLPAEDRAALTSLLGERVIGKAVAARPIEKPAEWYPLREGVLTYDITGGRKSGSTQDHVFQRLESDSRSWSARMGEEVLLHLGTAADGSIVIEAE